MVEGGKRDALSAASASHGCASDVHHHWQAQSLGGVHGGWVEPSGSPPTFFCPVETFLLTPETSCGKISETQNNFGPLYHTCCRKSRNIFDTVYDLFV